MFPSYIESLQGPKIRLCEGSGRIEYFPLINYLQGSVDVDSQAGRVPHLPDKRLHGFLFLRHDQQAKCVTLKESIEWQWH
jgi:hypothetical protein